MSMRVENTLHEVDQAMNKLKKAVDEIKIRREFFGITHKRLTTAVAALTVEIADHAGCFGDD
ncbi:hypothetical protein [Actinokineospora sp. UTMC 2448]|uniref:hypothetical protein n=1 Tax=Actinokineospora sp. UTMC 2448 TaxID=2268449 RepID=UPI0021648EFE|nr:hypothetical protein [Actinokineospora sp. UTMC 2448]UVS78379.1 hypothetical protein Actkin_02112 [Actinokineospora sp. UTMC 2448]